jgi:hypothetical protein
MRHLLIKKENGKILLDDEAERILRDSFLEVIQPVNEPFDNQFDSEIEFFREQNKSLQNELTKEREFSRTQSDKIAELAEKLAELTRNGQILLKQEQNRNILMISDERPSEPKKSFLRRLFNKKTR